ncbi:sesquipedalian [Anaeramoeba flamelloides]|uniref:Sesquipedalian n=1 Tax=Anaeramoeba flamelloides TaxID=1746091 RepID=A0AAV7Z472_9EUKA|nr:sesquipedalian [Anaeramoeba flamelloides]
MLNKYQKEGWLKKRGHRFKTIKKRYFILKKNKLKYYANDNKKKKNNKPKGVINLYQAIVEEYSESLQFIVKERNGKCKEYLLIAFEEEEKSDWIKTLKTVALIKTNRKIKRISNKKSQVLNSNGKKNDKNKSKSKNKNKNKNKKKKKKKNEKKNLNQDNEELKLPKSEWEDSKALKLTNEESFSVRVYMADMTFRTCIVRANMTLKDLIELFLTKCHYSGSASEFQLILRTLETSKVINNPEELREQVLNSVDNVLIFQPRKSNKTVSQSLTCQVTISLVWYLKNQTFASFHYCLRLLDDFIKMNLSNPFELVCLILPCFKLNNGILELTIELQYLLISIFRKLLELTFYKLNDQYVYQQQQKKKRKGTQQGSEDSPVHWSRFTQGSSFDLEGRIKNSKILDQKESMLYNSNKFYLKSCFAKAREIENIILDLKNCLKDTKDPRILAELSVCYELLNLYADEPELQFLIANIMQIRKGLIVENLCDYIQEAKNLVINDWIIAHLYIQNICYRIILETRNPVYHQMASDLFDDMLELCFGQFTYDWDLSQIFLYGLFEIAKYTWDGKIQLKCIRSIFNILKGKTQNDWRVRYVSYYCLFSLINHPSSLINSTIIKELELLLQDELSNKSIENENINIKSLFKKYQSNPKYFNTWLYWKNEISEGFESALLLHKNHSLFKEITSFNVNLIKKPNNQVFTPQFIINQLNNKNNKNNLFLIYGKAGSGKTTLLKYISQHLIKNLNVINRFQIENLLIKKRHINEHNDENGGENNDEKSIGNSNNNLMKLPLYYKNNLFLKNIRLNKSWLLKEIIKNTHLTEFQEFLKYFPNIILIDNINNLPITKLINEIIYLLKLNLKIIICCEKNQLEKFKQIFFEKLKIKQNIQIFKLKSILKKDIMTFLNRKKHLLIKDKLIKLIDCLNEKGSGKVNMGEENEKGNEKGKGKGKGKGKEKEKENKNKNKNKKEKETGGDDNKDNKKYFKNQILKSPFFLKILIKLLHFIDLNKLLKIKTIYGFLDLYLNKYLKIKKNLSIEQIEKIKIKEALIAEKLFNDNIVNFFNSNLKNCDFSNSKLISFKFNFNLLRNNNYNIQTNKNNNDNKNDHHNEELIQKNISDKHYNINNELIETNKIINCVKLLKNYKNDNYLIIIQENFIYLFNLELKMFTKIFHSKKIYSVTNLINQPEIIVFNHLNFNNELKFTFLNLNNLDCNFSIDDPNVDENGTKKFLLGLIMNKYLLITKTNNNNLKVYKFPLKLKLTINLNSFSNISFEKYRLNFDGILNEKVGEDVDEEKKGEREDEKGGEKGKGKGNEEEKGEKGENREEVEEKAKVEEERVIQVNKLNIDNKKFNLLIFNTNKGIFVFNLLLNKLQLKIKQKCDQLKFLNNNNKIIIFNNKNLIFFWNITNNQLIKKKFLRENLKISKLMLDNKNQYLFVIYKNHKLIDVFDLYSAKNVKINQLSYFSSKLISIILINGRCDDDYNDDNDNDDKVGDDGGLNSQILITTEKNGDLRFINYHNINLLTNSNTHYKTIQNISLSSNNNFFATLGNDKQIIVWDSNLYHIIAKTFESNQIIQFCFSFDDQQILYSIKNEGFKLWNFQKNEKKLILTNQNLNFKKPLYFNFINNEKIFIINGDSIVKFEIYDWIKNQPKNRKVLKNIKLNNNSSHISFSNDSTFLYINSDDYIYKLSNQSIFRNTQLINSIKSSFSPDSSKIILLSQLNEKEQIGIKNKKGDNNDDDNGNCDNNDDDSYSLSIYDIKSRSINFKINKIPSPSFFGLSSDNQYLIIINNEKKISIYSLKNKKVILLNTLNAHFNKITSLCFFTNKNCFLTSSQDSIIKLWEISNGKIICKWVSKQEFNCQNLNLFGVTGLSKEMTNILIQNGAITKSIEK